ncbi:MAG: formylglycine-generating enzyme family protein [Anaerolineae bacterium]|nr:formylglycine-generating enzyme family protein [Anaerolineae bacterium]
MSLLKFQMGILIWSVFGAFITMTYSSNAQEPISLVDTKDVEMVFVPGGNFIRGTDVDNLVQICRDTYTDQYNSDCSDIVFSGLYQITEPEDLFVNGFYMDKYEVSIDSYIGCIEADVCDPFSIENIYQSYIVNPDIPTNLPVTEVTYYDAAIYCAWRGGRLPTTTEWEYAASGQDNRLFPWGDDITEVPANHCDTNCSLQSNSTYDDGFRELAPAISFEDGESWAGIYNLSGNVSEWTSTRSFSGTDITRNIRLTKGGSYYSPIFALSIWFSAPAEVDDRLDTNGFRCVRTTDLP